MADSLLLAPSVLLLLCKYRWCPSLLVQLSALCATGALEPTLKVMPCRRVRNATIITVVRVVIAISTDSPIHSQKYSGSSPGRSSGGVQARGRGRCLIPRFPRAAAKASTPGQAALALLQPRWGGARRTPPRYIARTAGSGARAGGCSWEAAAA